MFRIILLLGILSLPITCLAGSPIYQAKSFIVPQKIVQVAYPYVSVVGVPVTNLGLSYYWSVEDESIIEQRVEKALEKIYSEEENYEVNPEEVETIQEIEDNDIEESVTALFLNKCNNCHDGSDPDRWVILKDEKLNPELTTEQWWEIFDKVDGQGLPLSKVMPKNGDPLEDNDVHLVRDYVRSLKKK